jgi:hypothetical protein
MIDGNSNNNSSSYHRGDPLDIPLIDQHLLVHLLCPRITSAIRYAFPQLYLEWTTGVAAADGDTNNRDGSSSGPLIRKRWIEMLLHISLLVGSCHFSSKRNNSKETSVYLATPAMRNLGMILRPTSAAPVAAAKNEHPLSSKIKVYSKIVALVLATVVVPALYEELKLHRQKQLEKQETRLRLAQLSREFRSTHGNDVQQEQQQQLQQQRESIQQQQQGDMLQQRAQKRKTLIQKFIVDSILGMSDILIPPLQLVNYLSYLWGLSYTPNIGSSLIGWEYASITTDGQSSSSLSGSLNPFQRHANFQYANRRLMVEEGLRTMAAILPPRRNAPDNNENGRTRRRRSVEEDNTDNSDNDRPNANNNSNTTTQISPHRRMSWMRQRALSFMGVVEEEEASEQRPYDKSNELKCSLCQTLNPSIPYITSCGHCYCYLCLRMSVTDDPYYRCVCCRKRVGTSTRISTTTAIQ